MEPQQRDSEAGAPTDGTRDVGARLREEVEPRAARTFIRDPHPERATLFRSGPRRAARLLPPIQRDTLALIRPYEAGLQWIYRGGRARHETWLNWQRLNTPSGREVFDGGSTGEVQVRPRLALAYQGHIVHRGGQLYSTGAVSDSWVAAAAPVMTIAQSVSSKVTTDAYVLVSRYVPDREHVNRATSGMGMFVRAAWERGPWRTHAIVWRGNDFIKEEGDPNYGGLRRDDSRYRKVRDYAEIGLTRSGHPVGPLLLEGAARLHRVESHYEYSYRILGRVRLRWTLRQAARGGHRRGARAAG